MITITLVDAALDVLDEDEDGASAEALVTLLDEHGEWDWDDGSTHDPSDRIALVESSGAYWVVYAGTEPDQAWRFGLLDDAERQRALLIAQR